MVAAESDIHPDRTVLHFDRVGAERAYLLRDVRQVRRIDVARKEIFARAHVVLKMVVRAAFACQSCSHLYLPATVTIASVHSRRPHVTTATTPATVVTPS